MKVKEESEKAGLKLIIQNTYTVASGPITSWQIDGETMDAQSHLILCDPMDCSLPGSSVHGIFPARILEWVAIYSSKGSSQPRDQTHISFIASSFFTCWTIRRGQSWRAWQQFHCQLLSLCYSRNEKVTPHLWWISPSPKPGREWAAGYCPTQGKTCFEKKNSN